MTAPALRVVTARLQEVLPAGAVVRVGVEAAGHYHRPLLAGSAWPAGWQVLELNPAHVTEQRRVRGRRGVKTDAVDLEAMTDLLLAGQGVPVAGQDTVIVELAAWAAHRARRVHARTVVKNQLLGQLDRCFPALTLVLPDVLGTKAGRLVAAEFADPARLAAPGATRFTRFAATRGQSVRDPDQRAGLGRGPRRRLRRRAWRPRPVARPVPDLPRRRPVTGAVRVRRQAPRRCHQPRGQR